MSENYWPGHPGTEYSASAGEAAPAPPGSEPMEAAEWLDALTGKIATLAALMDGDGNKWRLLLAWVERNKLAEGEPWASRLRATALAARPEPTNAQHEPPYPGARTVMFAIRGPNLVAHLPTLLCREGAPHAWADCGEVRGPAEREARAEALTELDDEVLVELAGKADRWDERGGPAFKAIAADYRWFLALRRPAVPPDQQENER